MVHHVQDQTEGHGIRAESTNIQGKASHSRNAYRSSMPEFESTFTLRNNSYRHFCQTFSVI